MLLTTGREGVAGLEERQKGGERRSFPEEVRTLFNISGDERNRMEEASRVYPGMGESGRKSMCCLFIGLTSEPARHYICQTQPPPLFFYCRSLRTLCPSAVSSHQSHFNWTPQVTDKYGQLSILLHVEQVCCPVGLTVVKHVAVILCSISQTYY